MAYKGIAKGNIVVLDDGVFLPEGIEVEVVLATTPRTVQATELQERRALGAQMKAFSERIAERELDLSRLVLEARQELDERA